MTERISNDAATTLAAGMLIGDLTASVVAFALFPSQASYRIKIDDEIMLVTAGAGTADWTVTRAQEGTSAAAHAIGATVTHVLTAASLALLIDEAIAAHAGDYEPAGDYAPASEGVTGGNSHDHNGGDGAQIDYGNLGNLPTLGTAAAKNIPAVGNASATEVVYGSDTRLTDARTPAVHAHAPADVTGTAVIDNDARLSDARTPVAHGHAAADVTGTAVVDNDARLTNARTPTAHAGSHATAQSDAIAPGDIGAATSGHNHTGTYEPADADIQTHLGLTALNSHGSTASTDIDFAKFQALNAATHSGADFPADPAQGFFYHTTSSILFFYTGVWRPMFAYGAFSLYVDKTNGSDAVGKGYASGASACATIQYAVNLIPAVNGGNVIINVAAGTYNETVTIQGKAFSGPYSITIQGAAYSATYQGTISTYTSDADTYYIDVAGTPLTANALEGYFIKMTSGGGSGAITLIESNTTSRMRLIYLLSGAAATNTFDVYKPSTIMDSVVIQPGQLGIVVNDIEITKAATNLILNWNGTSTALNRCRITGATGQSVNNVGFIDLTCCYVAGGGTQLRQQTSGARTRAWQCWFRETSGSANCVDLLSVGLIFLVNGTTVSNSGGNGCYVGQNALLWFMYDNAVGNRCRVRNNGTYGVYVETGAQTQYGANNYYTGNGTADTLAVAASFGYYS